MKKRGTMWWVIPVWSMFSGFEDFANEIQILVLFMVIGAFRW